jgi:hypothetical protein
VRLINTKNHFSELIGGLPGRRVFLLTSPILSVLLWLREGPGHPAQRLAEHMQEAQYDVALGVGG